MDVVYIHENETLEKIAKFSETPPKEERGMLRLCWHG